MVAQGIPQEIKRQHGQHHAQGGKYNQVRNIEDVVAPVASALPVLDEKVTNSNPPS